MSDVSNDPCSLIIKNMSHYFSSLLKKCQKDPSRLSEVRAEAISQDRLEELADRIVTGYFRKCYNGKIKLMNGITAKVYEELLHVAATRKNCKDAVDTVVREQEELPEFPLWVQISISDLLMRCAKRQQLNLLCTAEIRSVMTKNVCFRKNMLMLYDKKRRNKETKEFFESFKKSLETKKSQVSPSHSAVKKVK